LRPSWLCELPLLKIKKLVSNVSLRDLPPQLPHQIIPPYQRLHTTSISNCFTSMTDTIPTNWAAQLLLYPLELSLCFAD
jgi:hypothetical protein